MNRRPLILDRARAVALSPRRNRPTAQCPPRPRRPVHPPCDWRLRSAWQEILPGHATENQAETPRGDGRATLRSWPALWRKSEPGGAGSAARGWPRLRWVRIDLAGRHDLAQHFVVSAALAAWSGEPVADAIGLYKELKKHPARLRLLIHRPGGRPCRHRVATAGERADILIDLAGGLRDSDLLHE